MSAALNTRADMSNQSVFTQPDLSLGSLASGFSTPARTGRIASTSTAASSAPLATPSPPNAALFTRKRIEGSALKRFGSLDDGDEGDEGDMDALDTPAASRMKRTRSAGAGKGGVNLTLRDQEKHIDSLKKENFNIKLKVHFLEERLAQLAPDQIDAALKQNINLKIEVHQRGMEIKKLKKLVLELERELERTSRGQGSSQSRARELEDKLEEREHEIRELRRRRSGGADDAVLRELESRNMQLEEELEGVRGLLEENMEEMERLREMAEQRGEGSDGRMRKRLEDLEDENEELRLKLGELEEAIAARTDEKEDLLDEVEALRLEIEDVQRRREAESIERSQSRAQVMEEREEREAVEEDLNAIRDKLAAAHIEIQQKEDEIDMKNREIDELVGEHERIVDTVSDQWRGEVDEVKGQLEELRDVLEQRDAECKELRMTVSEYEAESDKLHGDFERTIEHLDHEAEERDAEIEAANREIQKLGDQIYVLEEESERLKEEYDRAQQDNADEKQRYETLTAALKQKVTGLKAQLSELQELYDAHCHEVEERRAQQEELARHIEKLVSELQREKSKREQLQGDLDKTKADYDDALRREKRGLEAKDLCSLNGRETLQVSKLYYKISNLSRRSSASRIPPARFSLELEVDRLKRDVERLEDELSRARRDLDDKDGKNRDRDGVIDKLHAENRDLATQLAAQTQARINVSEKLDDAQGSLKAAESEVATLRAKIAELEQRLSKDQRTLISAEAQYRDQLTERNTLLLTIYQYMDKILGVDKTPKKNGQAETKPFTNFSVFHDNLITRLKALSQIQLDFDKRVKEAESKFADKLNDMRKQLESRWRQIDRFETSVRTLADAKLQWKKKMASREGEIDVLKITNSELQSALSSTRKGPGDPMEIRSLTARAQTAERRLTNVQNQLVLAEEKITSMGQKTTVADTKWEARVREYESRLKTAEEKVKRERQGGKERALELESQVSSFKRQIELAQKRIAQLNEIIENAGVSSKPPTPR
ncbi:hypothetical protein QCA50_017336 [Cerrena zonata]|uniref:Centrosomin N-terminal motif 1 domain-containing protein n=1 Tax=Cerrena zonata TaxID=2478898 RepID=A0AAW0FL12_9APHY